MGFHEAFPFIRMKTKLLCWSSFPVHANTLESTPAQFAWGCQRNYPINWHRRVKLREWQHWRAGTAHKRLPRRSWTLKFAKLRNSFLLPFKCIYKCTAHVWSKKLNKTLKLDLISPDLEYIHFIHQVLMNSNSFVHQFLKFTTSLPSSGKLSAVFCFWYF